MYRRDYILRLIERFARALIALRDRILRRETDSADVRAEIHGIAREAGLDLDIARMLDPTTLLMWLAPTSEVDEARFWLLGELLYLDALGILAAEGSGAARPGLGRALALFSRLPAGWTPPGMPVSAGERVAEIETLLKEQRSDPGPLDERPGT